MTNAITAQQARVNFYALLSRLHMQEIDGDFLDTISKDDNIMSFFPNFKDWDVRKESSTADLLNKYLNVDFANLYLMHIIPYESFYTRDDQMIESGGDNPILELYNDYDFRVELERARIVSPDHIGVELEFMYMLAAAQLDALKDGADDAVEALSQNQKDFFDEHILKWMPMFLINLKEESSTPFYFDLADLTMEFILSDYETLSKA